MIRNISHEFTRENIGYCQDFFNYMLNVDPFKLEFLLKVVFPFMILLTGDTDIHLSIMH